MTVIEIQNICYIPQIFLITCCNPSFFSVFQSTSYMLLQICLHFSEFYVDIIRICFCFYFTCLTRNNILRFLHDFMSLNILLFSIAEQYSVHAYTKFVQPATYQTIFLEFLNFELLRIQLIWTFVCTTLCGHRVFFYLGRSRNDMVLLCGKYKLRHLWNDQIDF